MSRLINTLAAGALLASTLVHADYPERAVNYIIPFGPGGESDVTARLQQPFFEAFTGEELVIQYKPGGGGAVGWSQLNDMDADGYTIMGTNLPHIILKPMQDQDVGFETADIHNIYFFHYTPDAIIVKADSSYQSVQDIIDAAKAAPGTVTLSGSGTFTANHVAKERFDKMAGIITTYIPFKGTGAAVTALLGDQVQAEWGYSTIQAAQGDKVRMLAVAMAERHPNFPDVPTFKELGFDLVSGAYRGIAVPADTPDEIKQELSGIIDQINQDADFRQKMLDGGFALINVPLAEMDAFMAERQEEYSAAAAAMGIEQ